MVLRWLYCCCHFQILVAHIQNFHNRCSKCPPCIVKHYAALLIFWYSKWSHRHVNKAPYDTSCLFWPISHVSTIWLPISETPCISESCECNDISTNCFTTDLKSRQQICFRNNLSKLKYENFQFMNSPVLCCFVFSVQSSI